MKRTSASVDLRLYAALFSDIVAWDVGLHKSLEGDFGRLLDWPSEHLEHFLMIDLVKAGKIVDKALSSGYLDVNLLPPSMGAVINGAYRPFLMGLVCRIFDGWGHQYADADPTTVAFLRQVLYLAKKVKKDCSDAAILTEVRDFARIDNQLRQPTLGWDASAGFLPVAGYIPRLSFRDGYQRSSELDSERSGVCPKPLLLVLDRVCGVLLSQFPVLDWRDIRPKHGPGAVADSKSGTDKYLFPTWPGKLEQVFPASYFAQSREDMESSGAILEDREFPARLIAVPKTLSGPRMIASEPTSHQYIQHGLMTWLRESLPPVLRSCISFLDQDPSRVLCLAASEHGRTATVDLSAASDRLSCWTVERAFQYNADLLNALWACRTRRLVNATTNSQGKRIGEDYEIQLKKFAPMGSGVTFPVQSIIYACVAIASVCYDWGLLRPSYRQVRQAAKQIRVFGDDIMLPSYAVPTLVLLLEELELKVNASKTHWQGYFRESCGMDAYKGYSVTPTYLRSFSPGESCQDLASWVDVSNNAHTNGLWRLADAMVQMLPESQRKLIPQTRESMACLTLRTFSLGLNPTTKKRWNANLHRDEVLGLQIQVKTERMQRESHQSLLQYFVEDPEPTTMWTAGWTGRQRFSLKKRWVSSN